MGEIKIADIKNEAFRKIAENANKAEYGGNANEFLDGSEISVFKEHASFAGATEQDFTEMGLAVETQQSENVTNPQVAKKPEVVLTRAEQKAVNKEIKDYVKSLIKADSNQQALLESIDKKFAKRAGNYRVKLPGGGYEIQDKYAKSVEEVKAVISAANPETINTKEDVDGFKKAMLQKFPKATDLQKDIIDKMKDWAEKTAIRKQYDKLVKNYEAKLNGSRNFKKALDEVEKELKTKGANGKEWDNDYVKDAFKSLEVKARKDAVEYERTLLNTSSEQMDANIKYTEQLIAAEQDETKKAKLEQEKAELERRKVTIDKLNNPENKGDIRKVLKEDNTEKDEFLEDAYRKRYTKDTNKTVKADMRSKAADNKVGNIIEDSMGASYNPETGEVEMVSQVDADEMLHMVKKAENGISRGKFLKQYTGITGITKESTKNAQKLIAKLEGNEAYVNRDASGNIASYNIEALSKDLQQYVGYDMTLSREDADEKMQELYNTRAMLKDKTGHDFTKSEAKALVKMCGISIEHKDYLREGLVGAIPTAVGGVAGWVGGFIARASKLKLNQDVDLTFNDKVVANDILSQLEKKNKELEAKGLEKIDYTSVEAGGFVKIHIHQGITRDSFRSLNAFMGALNGLAIGAATGILAAIIFDGGDKSELSCISVSDYNNKDSRYTDPELFKEHLENTTENPIKLLALKTMVDRYYKEFGNKPGDEWHAHFWNDIRLAAGVGSKLNPEECRKFYTGGVYVPNTPEPVVVEEEQKPEEIVKSKKCEDKEVDYVKNAARYSWSAVNKMYSCFDGMNFNLATRIMKVVQAIEPDKVNGFYDIDRITEIAMKTMTPKFGSLPEAKIREALQAYPEVNADTFMNVIRATYVGNSKQLDKDNKLTTPLRFYHSDGSVACERDLNKLIRPKASGGKGPGTNNALGKLDYQECTYKVQGQKVDKVTWDNTVSNDRVHVTIIEE